jgi:hypothetical protein
MSSLLVIRVAASALIGSVCSGPILLQQEISMLEEEEFDKYDSCKVILLIPPDALSRFRYKLTLEKIIEQHSKS